MTPAQEITVEALAQLDALYEPLRDPRAAHWAATWVMRKRYKSRGLPYRGQGTKDRERDLTEAAKGGMVIRRRARQKTTGLSLTERGIAEAWKLIGEHPYAHAIVYDECLRHAPPGTWLPEIAFNEGRGWGDGRSKELAAIQSANLPAMILGLVESNCLTAGNVCYRLVPGAERPETPQGWDDMAPPESDHAAMALYERTYQETIRWLNVQSVEGIGARGDIGGLPLAPWHLMAYQRVPGSCLPKPKLPTYRDGSPVPGWSLDADGLPVYDQAAADRARKAFSTSLTLHHAGGD